jgi:hypothetical protein
MKRLLQFGNLLLLLVLFPAFLRAQTSLSCSTGGYCGNSLSSPTKTGDTGNNNYADGIPIVVTVPMTVVDFKIYLGAASGTVIVYIVQDTNTSGATIAGGTVICSASTTSPSANAVNTFSPSGCGTLSTSYRYWLMQNNNTSTTDEAYDSSGTLAYYKSSTCCTIPGTLTGALTAETSIYLAMGVDLNAQYSAAPSETNTASDSLNRALTASRGDSETNTASDSLGRVHGMYPTLSETNTAADTLARLVQWLRADSETNPASDSLGTVHNGGAHAYSASPSEANTASDTLARLANWLRTDAETNTAGDSLGRLAAYGRTDSETNTASDGLARLANWLRADAETNTAGDSLARAAALWRGNVIALYWQASAGGAGNSSYTYSVYRGTSAGGESSNPIASGLDAGCSGYASCLYLDYNVSPGTTYYYEVATAYSGVTSPVSSEVALAAQPATVAETHTAGDALGKLAGHFASLAESNTAADTLGRQSGFNRADSETNTTSDLVARLATWLRGDSETNTALDTLSALHGGSGIHNAVMSETLALSDALARLGVFGRSDSETHATGDSLGRSAGFARLETEPGGTSDVLARTRTAFASLIEIDSVGDSLARLAIFQRAVSEYDVVSDMVIFVRGGKVVVLPRHAGAVPGRTKTGTAPPH